MLLPIVMLEKKYYRSTIEGEKGIHWICGCFETKDGFFKFCDKHKDTLCRAVVAQIDELDMTRVEN